MRLDETMSNQKYLNILTEDTNLIKLASGSVSTLFQLPEQELETLQLDMIRISFDHHVIQNVYYQELCKCQTVRSHEINSIEELIKIPLIPVSAFKKQDSHKLLSVPITQVEHEMRSTGTSGVPSVARRCPATVDAAIQSAYGMYREFLKVSKGAGLYLCPSTEEIPEMGMIKALNMLAGLLDTHRFMVRGEKLIPQDAIRQLVEWDSFTRHIIGPPFLVYRFVLFLKATNTKLKLDKESMVITLGGWKRFNGKIISRKKFNEMCQEWLGVPKDSIRDIYGLVESNLLAVEDEQGIKHVSPTARISVRDVDDTSREVPLGKRGQLAIYDPTNLTVPGFLLTEDIVVELPKRPNERRAGQRMRYVMRAPTSKEFGCCAVNLEKKLESDEPRVRDISLFGQVVEKEDEHV